MDGTQIVCAPRACPRAMRFISHPTNTPRDAALRCSDIHWRGPCRLQGSCPYKSANPVLPIPQPELRVATITRFPLQKKQKKTEQAIELVPEVPSISGELPPPPPCILDRPWRTSFGWPFFSAWAAPWSAGPRRSASCGPSPPTSPSPCSSSAPSPLWRSCPRDRATRPLLPRRAPQCRGARAGAGHGALREGDGRGGSSHHAIRHRQPPRRPVRPRRGRERGLRSDGLLPCLTEHARSRVACRAAAAAGPHGCTR